MSINNKINTEKKLKSARDTFFFSLGAYALLTQEPSRSELPKYKIKVNDQGFVDITIKDQEHFSLGTTYKFGFNEGLDTKSAGRVVEYSFRQMILESYEAVDDFAKANGKNLEQEIWYWFSRHYRNGVGHNGRWDIRHPQHMPVEWRNKKIEAHMHNQPIDGFFKLV